MSDVLISYSREDRARAEKLATELKENGFSVWWDRKIPPGQKYEDVIQEALKKARCVIVLWSKTSVDSDWVKAEAEVALGRNVLIPALLDKVDPPIGFSRIQAADLTNWKPKSVHQDFEHLLSSVEPLTGRTRKKRKARSPAKKRKARSATTLSLPSVRVWISVLSVLVAAVAVVGILNRRGQSEDQGSRSDFSINLQEIEVFDDGEVGDAKWTFDVTVVERGGAMLAEKHFDSFAYSDEQKIYGNIPWDARFAAIGESVRVSVEGVGPDGRKASGKEKLPSGSSLTVPVVVAGNRKKGDFIFKFSLTRSGLTAK